jgi:N utilization substance protein B
VGHDADTTVSRLISEAGLPEEGGAFARDIVRGVMENKAKIDNVIRRFAPSWPVEQLSPVDRNILRVAIFEFLIDNKVSAKIAINEAIELAKTFSSDSAHKFINGVLGSVNTHLKQTQENG